MEPAVLIIGAGPVGMTAASELARFGIPVRIIDKAAQRTREPVEGSGGSMLIPLGSRLRA